MGFDAQTTSKTTCLMQKPARLFSLFSHSLRGVFFSVHKGDPSVCTSKTKNDSNKLQFKIQPCIKIWVLVKHLDWECWVKTSFFCFCWVPLNPHFLVSCHPKKMMTHFLRARPPRCSICFFKRRSLRGPTPCVAFFLLDFSHCFTVDFFFGQPGGMAASHQTNQLRGTFLEEFFGKKISGTWVF